MNYSIVGGQIDLSCRVFYTLRRVIKHAMINRTIVRAGVLAAAFSAVAMSSASITIATFSDPAINSSTPLFSTNFSVLNGSWSSSNLNLSVLGTTYNNATFTMTPVSLSHVSGGYYTMGSGVIQFKDSSAADILKITFGSGSFLKGSSAGSDSFEGDSVAFSGSALGGQSFTDSVFHFSFANPVNTPGNSTYTASFTSSGEPVPEPATMAVLGIGAVGIIRRRRASK